MKFTLKFFLLLAAVISCSVSFAYDCKIDGIFYDLDNVNRTASVTNKKFGTISSYKGVVNIPETITYKNMRFRVTKIGHSAFRGCQSLTQVTIPESVTEIQSSAFDGCTALPQIAIPESVTIIQSGAFSKCESLLEITIPPSVTKIENFTFSFIPLLQHITIPNAVTSIGEYSFCNCTSLSQITIPESVTSIGESAFSGCKSLKNITIPASVAEIGKDAFAYAGIKTITIQNPNVVGLEAALGNDFKGEIIMAEGSLAKTKTESSNALDLANNTLVQPKEPDIKRISDSATPAKSVNMENKPAASSKDSPRSYSHGSKSDIDNNIPEVSRPNDMTFALVIANENYRRESPVPFAANDGTVFAEYLKRTLGLPDDNIMLVVDASLNDIKFGLNKLSKICGAFSGEASAIVYYAGHGIPDEASKDAYLLPVDGYGTDPSTGYSLQELYAMLAAMPTKQTTVFLDACFSGSERNGNMMKSARGVKLKPKAPTVGGNMVVFSATMDDETAYPYNQENHGMFTFFLLKKLQDTKGDVTLGALADYIITKVKQTSIIKNDKIQTPTVTASPLAPDWQNVRL